MTASRLIQLEARFLKVAGDLEAQTNTCRVIHQAIEANEQGKDMQTYLTMKRVSAYRRYWKLYGELDAVRSECGE